MRTHIGKGVHPEIIESIADIIGINGDSYRLNLPYIVQTVDFLLMMEVES